MAVVHHCQVPGTEGELGTLPPHQGTGTVAHRGWLGQMSPVHWSMTSVRVETAHEISSFITNDSDHHH